MKNNTFHVSLSLDKERATNEQWRLAADAYMKSMGFDPNKAQYVLTRHADTAHDHVHITANRVQLDGSVISDSKTFERSHSATRMAELASGLTIFQKSEEMGNDGKMANLRSTIKDALYSSKNYDEFKTTLKQNHGIEVIENRSKTTGYVSGISYKTLDTGQTWKGSAIGKEFSYSNINKTLGNELTAETHIDTFAGGSTGGGGSIGIGGSSNLSKNLTKGREGLGLTAGQKDRIRKESSHEL